MTKIIDLLNKKFTRSVEIVPPRNGTDPNVFLKKLEKIKELGIDFLSVTKGAGGSLRGGTLPICHIAAEHGLNVLAHFTCRHHNSKTIENDLVDHNYFGLKNILALRGDPPDLADEQDKWAGEYKYAYQLVRKIKELNNGKYFVRENFDKKFGSGEGVKTDFCVGVAAHPDHKNFEEGIKFFKQKVGEGAEFAVTQMVFDIESYKRFIEEVKKEGINIPIIPGVWPMVQEWRLDQAENKFGVKVPDKFKNLAGLNKEEFYQAGLKLSIGLCKDLIKAGAPGIHLFIFDSVRLAGEIFSEIKR